MPHHAETSPRLAGTTVGTHRLLECIAREPDGWRYRAEDLRDGRTITLLEYFPHGLARRGPSGRVDPLPGAESELSAHRARFIAAAAESMGFDHPFLMPVERCIVEDGSVQVILPWCEGQTLAQRMERDEPVPPQELESWIRDACAALEILQRTRPMHGGLTPDRVMIRPDGRVVLSPLAIEPRLSTPQPGTGAAQAPAATLSPWMAPEQKWNTGPLRQGPWTDLYALAAMAVQCLTRQPFPNVIRRVDGKRLPDLAAHAAQGHRSEFLEGLKHALEMNPDERPRSVADWLKELALKHPTAPPEKPQVLAPKVSASIVVRGPRSGPSRRIAWGSAVAAGVAALLASHFLISPSVSSEHAGQTTTLIQPVRDTEVPPPQTPSLANQKALDDCIEALMRESQGPAAGHRSGARSPCS